MRKFVLALMVSATVAACGGGGGSSSPATVGGGGTPTPTPTPTPAPTFTYTKFADLSGDQSFPSACVDADASPIGTLRAPNPAQFGQNGIISYAAATDSWTARSVQGKSETFGPADLVSTASDETLYQKASTLGPDARFQIFNEQDGPAPFEYMRSTFSILFDPSFPPTYTACFIGVPTDQDDIPSATTVTYSDLEFGGFVIDEAPGQSPPSTFFTIVDGTGQINGNTGTGDVTIEFSLTIEDSSGVQSTIGPISGTVGTEFVDDVAGYSGLLNFGAVPEYTIAGGFFGPEGRETGFIFAASVDQNADGTPERSIFGGAWAKR